MVRPLKQDRGSIALTHIRVSQSTKALIDRLKVKHNLQNIDSVLRYYLPSDVSDNRPVFHSAKEIYNLTKSNRDIDRLIKDTSNQIMRKINKSEVDQSKSKPVHNKRSWQRRQPKF